MHVEVEEAWKVVHKRINLFVAQPEPVSDRFVPIFQNVFQQRDVLSRERASREEVLAHREGQKVEQRRRGLLEVEELVGDEDEAGRSVVVPENDPVGLSFATHDGFYPLGGVWRQGLDVRKSDVSIHFGGFDEFQVVLLGELQNSEKLKCAF